MQAPLPVVRPRGLFMRGFGKSHRQLVVPEDTLNVPRQHIGRRSLIKNALLAVLQHIGDTAHARGDRWTAEQHRLAHGVGGKGALGLLLESYPRRRICTSQS